MKGPTKTSKDVYTATPEHKWMAGHLKNGLTVINDDTGIGYAIFPSKMLTNRKQGKMLTLTVCEIFQDDAGKIIRRPRYVTDTANVRCPKCGNKIHKVRQRQRRWMQTTIEWDKVYGVAQGMLKLLGQDNVTQARDETIREDEVIKKDAESNRMDELRRKFGGLL